MDRLGDRARVSVGKGLKDDDPILRYMNFPQFKDLFPNGLNLTKAARYAQDDPFEGEFIELVYQITKNCIKRYDKTDSTASLKEESRKVREKSYVSCWTLSKYENVALWKIYGKDRNSIALKTTIGKLKQAIESFLTTSSEYDACLIKSLKKQIVKVEYIDHREMNQKDCRKHFVIPSAKILHYKNIGYEYEGEVRVIFGWELGCVDPAKLGEKCTIEISPKDFVTEIVVSPFAERWFYDLVQHEMGTHKMAELVKWSALNLKDNPGAYPNSN